MDVKRDPAILKKKKIRNAIFLGVALIGVIGISVAVSRLQPAAPSVPEGTLWFGQVKRGPFVREVRGAGTLVPEDIRWINTLSSGRVEKKLLQPGAHVEPGTVILELSNPDMVQNVRNAEMAWKTAQAQLSSQKVQMTQARLTQEVAVSNAESDLKVAQADLDANLKLQKEGIVSEFAVQTRQATVGRARNQVDVSKKALASAIENEQATLAPAEAQVNQAKAEFDRQSRQLDELKVRSTMSGTLQAVPVEVGQQVGPGTNLARVSDPTRLKAEIRISETQTKDLRLGLPADIDTRNGHVKGRVVRIDPAAVGGTVGVDVQLEGALPPGARADLSVDGTVELESLQNVLFVESPAFGQENGTISLYKVLPNKEAVRTTVKLGRRSVQFVEVVEGLAEGDRVVLSDMSQYDQWDRLRIN
ncbi:MAG TPA: HlyD family efflux transporter periplasmic adaptor subunit [Vicinamibacterales bacterium]|nr:HlyD family efflux transporter periplasmic adaptor subunit [Vicinamibacterales bacterium]